MEASDRAGKTCIYPGCERPAAPPHPLGGPQPSFCDLEEHNALTAHQERRRLEREESKSSTDKGG
jgi:colicin import membrane protein